MNRLNKMELECQAVLIVVRDTLANHKQEERPYESYMHLMGYIRDALKHLENKEYGCPSGKHAGTCDCA